jgi:hypothetical protein
MRPSGSRVVEAVGSLDAPTLYNQVTTATAVPLLPS